jgi:hypothetical protein
MTTADSKPTTAAAQSERRFIQISSRTARSSIGTFGTVLEGTLSVHLAELGRLILVDKP